jgi:hypothetical protein
MVKVIGEQIVDTAVMTERTAEVSPGFVARIAGVFYLLNILTAVFGAFFVSGRLIVHGDAAATATNILAQESLFQLGVAAGLIATACYLAVTALFYRLFLPVSRSLSLLAAFFSLMGCALGALGSLFQLAPLVVLGDSSYLSVFKLDQLQALALIFLEFNTQVLNIGIVFFGLYCLLIGYLIVRSSFLPRVLGALMVLAGVGWLTFLWPPLASALSPYNVGPGVLGEGLLTLWLLVLGVNAQRWKEQASAAGVSLL